MRIESFIQRVQAKSLDKTVMKPEGNEEMNFVYLWEEHFREMNSKYKYPTDQMRLMAGEKYYKIPSGSWESRC